MKQVEKEVRHKGNVIGKVQIPVYETIAEATKAMGEKDALAKINRQTAQDIMNDYRASATREVSELTILKRMAKSDPKVAEENARLVKKFKS